MSFVATKEKKATHAKYWERSSSGSQGIVSSKTKRKRLKPSPFPKGKGTGKASFSK